MKADEFGATHPGGVEHLQHHPVPHPQRRVEVGLGEDDLGLLRGEHDPRQPLGRFRQFDVGGRAHLDEALAGRPSVEDADVGHGSGSI